MKNIKITARYKKWKDGGIEDPPPDGIYRVRELNISLTGIKRVWLFGWSSNVEIDEVDLMINGVVVNWI